MLESVQHLPHTPYTKKQHLVVIFGGQNIRDSAILRHFLGNIFVVGAYIAGKGRGWVKYSGQTSNHENHEYFAPRKLHAIGSVLYNNDALTLFLGSAPENMVV